MHALDLGVLIVYLLGIVAFGAYFSRTQRTIQDYFVSGKNLPWWAIMGSIVATETSTVTFISVPGFAYGTNFTFLQLVMGYMVGRVAVSVLFIPAYFKGQLLTVYQLLGDRFGSAVKRLASGVFLLTRSFADGFRLFATGLVLAAALRAMPRTDDLARAWLPSVDPTLTILALSVFVIAVATVIYTFYGGMTAVIWTDVIQLVVYVSGACIAAAVLLDQIPGGWAEVREVGSAAGRFRLFDFTPGFTRSYTFWAGAVGGAFLTTATHGTDQLMVQRYFCARTETDARKALLWSGAVVFAQFVLFLVIGVLLFVYYTQHAPAEIAEFTRDGRVQTDRVFPYFIVRHLPPGIVGLVLAAIFAAAMSTLSSSLNSSSAAAVNDFYLPATGGTRGDHHYLRVSRLFTVAFGLVQLVVAIAAIGLSTRVVDEVLGIASFTNGIILGVFLLGTFAPRVGQRAAFAGIAGGSLLMLGVKLLTPVSWQWYVLIGSSATFALGWSAGFAMPDRGAVPGRRV
ncbi:MAG TPA: sodium:solute symporter [Vicinamibacterales bacterium]|nr:sodium:solute symporter [Vicinamibacterales bacterium]